MDDPLAHPEPIAASGDAAAHSLGFVAFGVAIRIESNRQTLLDLLRTQIGSLLAGRVDTIGERPVAHVCAVCAGQDGLLSLFLDGEVIARDMSEHYGLRYMTTRIKALIAESTQTHLFVHAGVVALGERAIVLPAHTSQGKTTLVRELVLRGASYYSDDVALFDRDGLVHPLPKPLSVRVPSGQHEQVEVTVESLSGVAGDRPLRVGLVLFTAFAADATWHPRRISPADAALKLLEHTGSVRLQPRAAMEVLGKVVGGGTILWESPRAEAAEVVDHVLRRLRQFAVEARPC